MVRATHAVAAVLLVTFAGACSRDSEAELEFRPVQAVNAAATLELSFRTLPDPPRSGNNDVEVRLRRADGTAEPDATITAVFYMPAMPSMNMPEMRTTFPLAHQREGIYRGNGDLVMGGTWEVTITVERQGERVGVTKRTVTAK